MTDRIRELRALFRGTALEQLAQLALAVSGLRRGTSGPAVEEGIGPALHLLKSDAALVGLMEIAAALHAAEERAAEAAWDALADALTSIARAVERDAAAAEVLEECAALEAGRVESAGGGGGGGGTGVGGLGVVPVPVEPSVLRRWVRLQTDAIDELSDRLLELSTAYNRLAAGLVRAVRDAPTEALRDLAEDADAARRQLDEVLGAAWSLRLASVEELLRRLADHAIELARTQGKPLQVRVSGGRAELERPTLEAIEEPLLHLIRNAIDHGIEEPGARGGKPAEALLVLEAQIAGGTVEIAIEDDGRGIDPDAVRAAAVAHAALGEADAAALSADDALDLLFQLGAAVWTSGPAPAAGLSSRSGRGVGLPAVRARIEGLGGAASLSARPGRGTRCVIAVPAAIAREHAVVVECAGGVFALPRRAVTGVIRLGDHAWRGVAGGSAVQLAEGWAPLAGLDEVLGLGAGTAAREDTPALVLEGNGRRRVFGVDRVDGEHDLLRRPADAMIGLRELVAASSVLDDGRIALWPSVPALLRGSRARGRRGSPVPTPRVRRVLVADDSQLVLELVSSMLRGAGLVPETVPDGDAAWRALESDELPDLLLTDAEMPGMDGFELVRRTRERWPQLPIVMLTTRDAEQDRRRAISYGANAYLLKSRLDERHLVDTIRRLIDEPV